MMKKRHVSDEEFYRAYRIPDNRAIIRSVLRRYANSLPQEDLDSCGMHGLWRALMYHRDSFGQKFTTSLHRFVVWEVRRELRRVNTKKLKSTVSLGSHDYVDENSEENENWFFVDSISVLPNEDQRSILWMYYVDGLTLEQIGNKNGYSKETARQKIGKAIRTLREFVKKRMMA